MTSLAVALPLSLALLAGGRSQPAAEKPPEAAEPSAQGKAGNAPSPEPAKNTAEPPAHGGTVLPQVDVIAPKPHRATAHREPKNRVASRAPARRVPTPVVLTTPATTSAPVEPGAPNVLQQPAGQPVTTVTDDRVKVSPALGVDDLVLGSPGITVKLGNGPRDWGISIRGSNARNGFGVRNIVMMEDGFPVTQPDGLSRTDLIDPHAYGAVDVWRGPSSALFGDYATGGAINFRLRRGTEINGFVYGTEGGSFGYLNNYFLMGGTNRGPNNEKFEGSLFASDVRGDGYISHFSFNTQTVNSLSTYSPTPDDRITFKFINNLLFSNLPIRLSLNQFQTNPFQSGCAAAFGSAPGCATIPLFANGFWGRPSPRPPSKRASIATTVGPLEESAGSMISTMRPPGVRRSCSMIATSTSRPAPRRRSATSRPTT